MSGMNDQKVSNVKNQVKELSKEEMEAVQGGSSGTLVLLPTTTTGHHNITSLPVGGCVVCQ